MRPNSVVCSATELLTACSSSGPRSDDEMPTGLKRYRPRKISLPKRPVSRIRASFRPAH